MGPYGEYECEIKMGSWTFHGNQLNLTMGPWSNPQNYIDITDLDSNSPLIFTKDSFIEEIREIKTYDCCPEPYISLNYRFKVQRRYRLTEQGMEKNPDMKDAFQSYY